MFELELALATLMILFLECG